MLKNLTLLIFTGVILGLSACHDPFFLRGNGDIVRDTWRLDPYYGVEVGYGIDVDVKIGNDGETVMRGDSNILDAFDLYVDSDDILVVELSHSGVDIRPSETILLDLIMPYFDFASLSGGAALYAPESVADSVSVFASQASRVEIEEIDALDLDVRLSGGSEARLTGVADFGEFRISGGSVGNAYDVFLHDALVDLSGGSFLEITADGNLDGILSGGSELIVDGDPDSVLDVSGGSTVVFD